MSAQPARSPVQTLMRHASLSSTMVYTAVDEDERRDGIDRLESRVSVEPGTHFRTEASAANYVARKAREAAAAAVASAS